MSKMPKLPKKLYIEGYIFYSESNSVLGFYSHEDTRTEQFKFRITNMPSYHMLPFSTGQILRVYFVVKNNAYYFYRDIIFATKEIFFEDIQIDNMEIIDV